MPSDPDGDAEEARRDVAVIFVHGILARRPEFAARMQKRLRRRLIRDGLHDYVHFRSVFWADDVREHQDEYFDSARAAGGFWHSTLRRYVIQGLGDAAAYQKTRDRENSIYFKVQSDISDKIKSLDSENRSQGRGLCPLIFIGHSLGSHVISSFLWDLNKLKQRTEDDIVKNERDIKVKELWYELKDGGEFRRLETCAGIVTLGSNIPMFTFTFGPSFVYPITVAPNDAAGKELQPAFPGAALPKPLKEKARWLNFYSRWDILGFPLKPLNAAYRKAKIIHDIRVWSEWPWFLPYIWCIFAHRRYWTNRTVLRETHKLIREMVVTPTTPTTSRPSAPLVQTGAQAMS